MKAKYFNLLFLVIGFSTVFAENQISGNSKNPVAVQEVLSGKRKTANAAWWGFDKSDSTDALQGAINSGASKVEVPYMGSDWIVRPIHLASNQEIVFDPGVVVIAKKDAFKGKRDCLFSGSNLSDITLRGYGATLRMRKKDYMSSRYTKSGWRHVLAFYGCSNITVLGFALESSGGDGIYIGVTKDKYKRPCRNVLIKDCICNDNYRQGISVISVDKLRIENCLLSNTKGTPPQAGIDLEPNNSSNILNDVVIQNCVSKNNAGPGFQVHLHKLTKESKGVSILIVDCHVKSSGGNGLTVAAVGADLSQGLVEFRNCIVEDIKHAGLHVLDKWSNTVKLRFDNCKWQNVANSRFRAPIDITLKGKKNSDQVDGIEFVNCYVYDEDNRPFLKIRNIEGGDGTYDVRGDIKVYNPHGAKIDSEITYKKPALKINSFQMRK